MLFQVAYYRGEKTLPNWPFRGPTSQKKPKYAYFQRNINVPNKKHGNMRGSLSVKKPRKYGCFREKKMAGILDRPAAALHPC
jgi:hypothetical protein